VASFDGHMPFSGSLPMFIHIYLAIMSIIAVVFVFHFHIIFLLFVWQNKISFSSSLWMHPAIIV